MEACASSFFHIVYIRPVIGIVVVPALNTACQGWRTTRVGDLYARTVLIMVSTSAFRIALRLDRCEYHLGRIYTAGPDNSPIASQANAKPTYRLFSPGPNDSANVTILISLLCTTTSNKQVFAKASLHPPIRSFCTRFLTGQDQRIGVRTRKRSGMRVP